MTLVAFYLAGGFLPGSPPPKYFQPAKGSDRVLDLLKVAFTNIDSS